MSENRFLIVSKKNNLLLTVHKGDMSSGEPVILSERENPVRPKQQWYVDARDTIRSAINGLCLDRQDGAITENGKPDLRIRTSPDDGSRSQNWKWESNKIYNPDTGRCMQASGGSGSWVIAVDEFLETPDQLWIRESHHTEDKD